MNITDIDDKVYIYKAIDILLISPIPVHAMIVGYICKMEFWYILDRDFSIILHYQGNIFGLIFLKRSVAFYCELHDPLTHILSFVC